MRLWKFVRTLCYTVPEDQQPTILTYTQFKICANRIVTSALFLSIRVLKNFAFIAHIFTRISYTDLNENCFLNVHVKSNNHLRTIVTIPSN